MSNLNLTRAQLEAAPQRKSWQDTTVYDSIYLLPTKKKHDSGWHLICIVGVNGETLEQAAWCDDICWKFEPARWYSMRTDMTHPGGVVHCWGARFAVGSSLSSTDVTVTQEVTK